MLDVQKEIKIIVDSRTYLSRITQITTAHFHTLSRLSTLLANPHSGAVLGPSWGLLGPSWNDLGGFLCCFERREGRKVAYAKNVSFPVGIMLFLLLGALWGVLLEAS